MTKILITGSTGTIGTQLVQTLRAKGIASHAMSSRPETHIEDTTTVYGDFAKPETLPAAFAGIDILFLLVPLAPGMVEFGKQAIAAAKAAGVRHVIRSSGAGADADSPFSLARAHGEIDRELQQSGLAWTILRPTSFMQNHLTYNLEQIRSGAYFAPHGNGTTSLVDVQDIAECAAAVIRNPQAHAGKIYTLTGGEALDDAAQMAAISAAIGRPVRYVDVPETAAVEGMSEIGFPPVIIDWLMSLNAVVKAGYAAGISDDVHLLTGHPPRKFADFVQANKQHWQTR